MYNKQKQVFEAEISLHDQISTSSVLQICGSYNSNLRLIERRLSVRIFHRGGDLRIVGEELDVEKTCFLMDALQKHVLKQPLSEDILHDFLHDGFFDGFQSKVLQEKGNFMPKTKQKNKSHIGNSNTSEQEIDRKNHELPITSIKTPKMLIEARGKRQLEYVNSLRKSTITFGVGPAGTGKTFMAVAVAVEALVQQKVERLVLVRPAVEAGEKLGFLPGDMTQKIDPYLRPLFDALHLMVGIEQVQKWQDQHRLELAPLAFMRGRTLSHSFVILDEAQNTSTLQMKMFLTRIGFGSTVAVTGDMTQTDLPNPRLSGLAHAKKILQNITGISFHGFSDSDVRRHELVQQILRAYDHDDKSEDTFK